MKKFTLYFILLTILTSCLEERPAQPEQNAIIDNLPINDRELLLGPLESALDDLKKSIEQSESYFASSEEWTGENYSGKLDFKLDGSDTVMVHLNMTSVEGKLEEHDWFYDKDGHLYYSEHFFKNPSFGLGQSPNERHYKFYFEEHQVLISSYARMAFDGKAATEDWTPTCLTKEEELFIQGRLGFVRKKLRPKTD